MTSQVRGKRVAIVTRSVFLKNGFGGLERAVVTQARALAMLGWRVTLVCPEPCSLTMDGIEVLAVPWPKGARRSGAPGFGAQYWFWCIQVAKRLRSISTEVDSLYVHGGAAGVLHSLGQAFRGKTIVANPHGMEEFANGGLLRWTNRVFTRHLSRGARYADVVVATDESMVHDVIKNLRVESSKVRVIPNAVDVPKLRAEADLGASLACPVDIVSVGRLVWNKGYDLLLDATRILLDDPERPSLTWRHYGSGEWSDRLRSAAARIGGLDFQIVSGASDSEVQAGMRAASVFVQPSRYEGSSLTTLEAMAHGTVCVGTPVGGIPDKLLDGVTGFLAEDVSAASIAAAIGRAEKAESSVGQAAASLVEKQFSLSTTARMLGSVLDSHGSCRRRVLQVARHIGPGTGVGQVAFSLEKAFNDVGVDTERLTLENVGLRMQTAISRNPVSKLALAVEVLWFSVFGTIAVQRKMKADRQVEIVVHGDPIGGDIYVNHGLLKAVMTERRGGRRFFIPANPMHWFTLLRDEYRYSHRMQRSIVNLNSRDCDTMRALYPGVKSPMYVIPNGVDLDRYRTVDEEFREQMRVGLGFASTDRVLLFVGNEFDRKGLFVIFDALMELPGWVKLLVVGGTPEMVEAAKSSADARGIEGRVRIVGAQDDTRPFYGASDIFLLPSAYEAAQLALVEALASGKPCVATPVGFAPDVVRPSENGELVVRSAAGVREGVLRVVDRLNMDSSSVKQVCQSSVAGFSWSKIATEYLDLLKELSERR